MRPSIVAKRPPNPLLGECSGKYFTELGSDIFQKAKDELVWFESDTKECWQYNLQRPTKMPHDRLRFWKEYSSKGIGFVIRKYGHDKLKTRIKRKIKRIIK